MTSANNRWSLTGKKAVVTGATKGIGFSIAADLLDLVATVLICARNAAEVETVVKEFRQNGQQAFGVAADVAAEAGRTAVFAAVEEHLNGLDVLINNVGTNIRKASLDYADEEYDRLWLTNVKSTFDLCRMAHPLLLKSANASIVNIVSVAGIVSVGTGTIYGMTKAALIQLTRGLATEWGADRIRVNAVAPWFTETPLTENLLAQVSLKQKIVERTPLGRIAVPADVSGVAAFLCLPAASYITGQCIAPDGGFLAKGF